MTYVQCSLCSIFIFIYICLALSSGLDFMHCLALLLTTNNSLPPPPPPPTPSPASPHDTPPLTGKDFDRFVSRFGPYKSAGERVYKTAFENGKLWPGFHGNLDRVNSNALLSKHDGSFLVRLSDKIPNGLLFCYSKLGKKNHLVIENLPDEGIFMVEKKSKTKTVHVKMDTLFQRDAAGSHIVSRGVTYCVGADAWADIYGRDELADWQSEQIPPNPEMLKQATGQYDEFDDAVAKEPKPEKKVNNSYMAFSGEEEADDSSSKAKPAKKAPTNSYTVFTGEEEEDSNPIGAQESNTGGGYAEFDP